MKFVDFDKISKSHAGLWAGDYDGRCRIWITAPKKPVEYPVCPDIVKAWTDGEEIRKRNMRVFENTYFTGDAFPLINLNFGASGHAGYFNNIPYKFADSVWFFPILDGERLRFSKDSFFYKKTVEAAEYLASSGNGDYIVSMPDIAGNLDALGHLRGSERVMTDMFDDPAKVKAELALIQRAWREMTLEVYNILKGANYGGSSIGWMGTYAKGLHSQLQCDMSVMLSPENFDEFVLGELEEQADVLEYPTYHFDGVEQKRHLQKILNIDKIKMIQYTCVAGQPDAMHELETLKQIQRSGKLLLIIVKPGEVKPLLDNLSAKGLYLVTSAETPGDADDLFKIAQKYSKETC